QRAGQHRSVPALGQAGTFLAQGSARKADRQHAAGDFAQSGLADSARARRSGMRLVLDLATARIPCPFTSVVTTRAVLEKSPAALDRLLRGILHGVKVALTSPDVAKKTIGRNRRLSDPEAIEEVYQRAIAGYERVPAVPKEAIETVVK